MPKVPKDQNTDALDHRIEELKPLTSPAPTDRNDRFTWEGDEIEIKPPAGESRNDD